jgi:translation elongation factor P/translation initiation factor 5A
MEADLHRARLYLQTLDADEHTLAYLNYAIDSWADYTSSELREILEPYCDVAGKDVDELLNLFPFSTQDVSSNAVVKLPMVGRHRKTFAGASEASSQKAARVTSTGICRSADEATLSHVGAKKENSARRSRAGRVSAAQGSEHDEMEVQSQGDSTYFQEAGSLRRGELLMIKDQPCRVSEVKSLGKVWSGPCMGCSQVQIIARSIFTGRKLDRIFPVKENVTMAFVKREEHVVIDIGQDGELTLLTSQCETKCDVNLPTGAEGDAELAARIREGFDSGKVVTVIVLSACGTDKVTQCKVTE